MLKIRQVPILQDNYSHLVIDTETREAAAVDPAEPGPVLAALAAEGARLTHVLCTHHHRDLKFALSIEPGNTAAREKLAWAEAQRAKALSTVPSTIGEELSFNPFMRVSHPAVVQAVGAEDPVEVMDRLRTRKNEFRA
jgi:hypothetical protein